MSVAIARPVSPDASRRPPPQEGKKDFLAYVNSFNRKTKLLITDLARRHPNDAVIARAQKRVNTAIDVSPLYVIDTMGGYLNKYAVQIYARDADFFVDNDYDAEIKQGVKQEKLDLVLYIMPKVKDAWRTLKLDAQKKYFDAVVELLSDYTDYLALVH